MTSQIRSASLLLLGAVALGLPLAARAQENMTHEERLALQRMRPRVGLFGNFTYNIHAVSDFQGLPEYPSCLIGDGGSYSGGHGTGAGVGLLLLELPLTPRWYLMARAGYYASGAVQSTRVGIGPVPVGNDTVPGISEYTFDAHLGMIAGGLSIGYRPFPMPLTLRGGIEIGAMPIRSVSQRERIVEPGSATFINAAGERTSIRNAAEGDIQGTKARMAAVAGVDYELPLNRAESMLIVPEVGYSYALTDVRPDLGWRVHQIRLGLAFKYSLPIPEPEEPTAIVAEVPPPPEPELAASVNAVSVEGGAEHDNLTIRVEEFINTQTRTLLPYIFFDEGSSELASRYHQIDLAQRSEFSLESLHNRSTIDVYHQTLNILGRRMVDDPKSTLALTGTNADRGAEVGNMALSRARAERVKSYLVERWGIEPSRISVSARNLPAAPSSMDDPDGMAENRRVEVTSNSYSLLEPVTTTDTLRTVTPPMLRLKPKTVAEAGVGRWSARVVQGDRLLKEFSGVGDVPRVLDWNIAEDQGKVPLHEAPLVSSIELRDARGVTVQGMDETPIEQITIRKKRVEKLNDTTFRRYNFIIFEYDKATLSPAGQRIAESIKKDILPSSKVDIVGYTDRLGEEGYNLELSRQRALYMARVLGVPAEAAEGAGENTTLFDNDLPEGRFLSRTVNVTVKTPVNGE